MKKIFTYLLFICVLIINAQIPIAQIKNQYAPAASFVTTTGKYLVSDAASLLNNEIKGTTCKFSISIWLKRKTVDATYQTIFSRDNNSGGRQFACEFTPQEEWSFFIANDATNFSWWKSWYLPMDTTKWYNFIMTFDNTQALASKCVMYMNNTVMSTYRVDGGAGVSNVNDQPTEPIYIDVTNFGGLVNPFKGYLSKISFFNGILSAADVSLIWNNGNSANCVTVPTSTPCYMYWDVYTATFSTNFSLTDSKGTSYGVSKNFTSSGMSSGDKVTNVYPIPYHLANLSATNTLISAFSAAPSNDVIGYYNEFINACTNNGNWALMDLFVWCGTDLQANAVINWKNPGTYNATEIGTPTWTANQGYTGNGSSMCLDMNYNPATNGVNYVLDDNSMGCYLRLNKNEATACMGHAIVGVASLVAPRNGGTGAGRDNCNTNVTYSSSNSQGLTVLRRTASNAQAIYQNGSSVASGSTTSISIPSNNPQVLAYNNNGTRALFSTNQVLFYFMGAGSIDQKKMYQRTRNLATQIGAQVQ